jgi:hypothetical protein
MGKEEAVERLLVQAVKLHFNDGDAFPENRIVDSAFCKIPRTIGFACDRF